MEAGEGADSEDDILKKELGPSVKEAYYDAELLKRRNKGLDDKIKEMEERAILQEEQRNAKGRAKLHDLDGAAQDELLSSDEEDALNDDYDQEQDNDDEDLD